MFDTILRGGTVIDGTGRPGFTGDVGITRGRIVEVGDLAAAGAANVIDVSGLTVAPGFIDMHTHSDFTLIADGRAESQVHQGVTTEVVGQCGISCAPVCTHDAIKSVSPWYTDGPHRADWRSFGDYLDALEHTDLGVNVMAFVGHGTIHRAVLGDQLRAGEPDEIARMARMVDQAMDEGAGGFSTGLEYWPGILASPNIWCRCARSRPSAAGSTPPMCATATPNTTSALPRRSRPPASPARDCRSRTSSPSSAPPSRHGTHAGHDRRRPPP